jgi:hypothetical protein
MEVLENVLGFLHRRPSCQHVLQQLEITRESNADDKTNVTVCKQVYKHLNDELAKNQDVSVITKLKNTAWLFLHGTFVENRKIALEWKGYAVPFLYSVPDEYKREFVELLKVTGIKEIFRPCDFLEALDSLQGSKQDSRLTPEDIKLVVTLINELRYQSDDLVKQRVGTIPLPDAQGVLCNSKDLTIPERFHVKYVGNERYIHSDINRNVALKLGAKPLRARRREKYGNTMSISFGQFEKLTDRIKNILESYPCDVGILKELVQNADDAKATEVQFIYDKRTLPHKRVLQTNANEIQGPALCVYNNKYFSEDDLNGICKLGIGSKRDDPAKTGQYGIGFNAVYHLTDCPSFLSDDNTLCILDPHCEYSPEASPEAPGGRYNNIDDDFKDIFSDTASGYLAEFGDHFPLQGCTMFRLPLRTDEQSKTSEISNCSVTDQVMMDLISEFKKEAKKLLLFLNHVKKIGLWEINKKSELKPIYSVSSQLERSNEKKLPELLRHLQDYKKVATCDVPIKDTTYTIRIEDTDKLKEKWLIHQRFGIKTEAITTERIHQSCGVKTKAIKTEQIHQSSCIKTEAMKTEQSHPSAGIKTEAITTERIHQSCGVNTEAIKTEQIHQSSCIKTEAMKTEPSHPSSGIKTETLKTEKILQSSGVNTKAIKTEQVDQSSCIKTQAMKSEQSHPSSGIKTETMKAEKNLQSSGIKTEAMIYEQSPNVCDLGLFPRGAIAALLSSNRVRSEEYVAYCFLPLPVKTMLPVHVNGHFALDGSRRDLWFDPSGTCRKTIWNTFMKKQVLGPAYASLITKAREYIPHCEKDSEKIYFSSKEDATKALDWYHNLFPNPIADPKWKTLAVAVYQCLKESPILPVVSQTRGIVVTEKDKQGEWRSSKSSDARFPRNNEETACSSGSFRNVFGKYSYHQPKYQESARESNSEHMKTARYATFAERRADALTKYYIEWLPPNIVYFIKEEEREIRLSLLAALLRIHMPVLLYTPLNIHKAMLESEVESRFLDPENVIKFLLTSQDESSRCNIGKLPVQLNSSNIQNKSNLRSILEYCEKTLKKFPEYIQGLPLLLTDDNMLRAFSSESPVYCSLFSKLFPDKAFTFVQIDFVSLLSTFCGLEPDVIRDLTIQSLATEFMPDVFNGKLELGGKEHVPWNYPEEGVLSKEWFSRLWNFLQIAEKREENKRRMDGKYANAICVEDNSTNESSSLVTYLGKYPIIPTTDGKLATVDNAKSILAVTNDKKGDYLQQEVTEILKSLACPFLDKSIFLGKSITKDALSVVLRLVADPHCVSDVLHVLDYMNSTGILDMSKFDEKGINSLLIFFQAECKNNESMNIAKTLSFYKGVDGDYHSLSSYYTYIVIPVGLPGDEIKELQTIYGKRVLFLPSLTSDLGRLYKALGVVVDCDICKFYITYVLPNFSSLSRKWQEEFLAIIKDTRPEELKELKQKLRSTRCIPDQSGSLRVASSYLNPHNELFKVMFKPEADVFPTAPFNKIEWIDFLIEIGLKEDCDEQQFVTFARGVKESARCMSKYDLNIIAQSKALVKYLLENGKNWFHVTISDIEFIAPEEVENELSSLHPQYRVNGKLEFVSYRESVPWKDRCLVWTSVKLLPDWAYPQFDPRLLLFLGIPAKPPLESVIDHVKMISKSVSEIVMTDPTLPEKIIEVFKNVYDFLTEMMQNCTEEPPFANCNEECRKIGKCLANVACILLSKERCLVKGERLSFEDTEEKLKPHFHMVPRDYVQYEHLLKRLGVTEKITPSQMGNVLKSLKDSCTKDTMNSEEEEKACFATFVLFESLRGDSTEVESRLSNCEELNLPSLKKRLVKSNELVYSMQSRLRESVAMQGYEILYPLEKCGLKLELEDAYLNALPKRLRPTPLSSLVREELDPSCKKNMACIYCTVIDCPFIQKIILVLRSSQFEHGILRLLKHQKNVSTPDDEDKERAARFTSTKVRRILCCKISNRYYC